MRITHRAIALPLAGVAILLSGCNEPGATASSAPVKDMPATLTGELTSQSPVNLNDGSRNQSFDLQLKGGTLYRVTSSGSLQEPKLTLLSGDNQLIDGPRNRTAVPAAGRGRRLPSGDQRGQRQGFRSLPPGAEHSRSGQWRRAGSRGGHPRPAAAQDQQRRQPLYLQGERERAV